MDDEVRARHSLVSWNTLIKESLRSRLEDFSRRQGVRGHRLVVSPDCVSLWQSLSTVQVDAHTDLLLIKNPLNETTSSEMFREEPASLVYTPQRNGSVLVLIYPHKSEISGVEHGRTHYVIDFMESANDLAGSAGKARIQKHLDAFSKLAIYSRCVNQPSPAASKFLGIVRDKSDKYLKAYGSPQEAKKAVVDVNLALGAGLVGGLISSSIIPLAKDYGSAQADLVKEIRTHCLSHDVSIQERCLSSRSFTSHQIQSEILSPASLLVICLISLIAVTRYMTKLLRD